MVFFPEKKKQTAKECNEIWQFLNDVGKNTLDIGEKKALARRMKNTLDVCFIWTSVGSWGKVLETVAQVMPPVRYWKNRIKTLLNDSSTASGLPNI